LAEVNLPLPPEPDDEEDEEEVVVLDLFADLALESVTSGSDTSAWDPVRIEQEDRQTENEDVLDTELESDAQPGGVTSGNEGNVDDEAVPTGAPGSRP
jgi:hypothetical protein